LKHHEGIPVIRELFNEGVILSATGIKKRFANQTVLDDVSITLRRGQVLALCGPSGCGKSTLLRILSGLESPDEGVVNLGIWGIEKNALRKPEIIGRIGFVFQRPALYPNMTVLDNITLALRNVRKFSAKAAEEHALAALAEVRLDHKAHVYPATLSGGQAQRASIARALSMEPEVLLLDEPTSALDPELVHEVLEVLRKLSRGGTTMAVATHELGFAREVAHEVAFFDQGKNLETRPSADFFSSPKSERAASFINSILNP
jgi:ABC-type polar amino acid transport system ATPase subunit